MSTPWWLRPPERGAPNEGPNEEPGTGHWNPPPTTTAPEGRATTAPPLFFALLDAAAARAAPQSLLQLLLATFALESFLELLLGLLGRGQRRAHLRFALLQAREQIFLLVELVREILLLDVEVLGHGAQLVDRVVALAR